MYTIKTPNEKYSRKISGVQFVNGVAVTDNAWLASWFSGRKGFTVQAEAKRTVKKTAGDGNDHP